MIEKSAKTLRSASLSILEVGGAFAHRFKELIEFLGITTLVITDIDSVLEVPEPTDEDDEEAEKEFEVPVEEEDVKVEKRYGSTCLPSIEGAVTANQTLIQWIPRKRTIAELQAANPEEKVEHLVGFESSMICVAYQTSVNVAWNGQSDVLCGRTLEEAFGLDNAIWCQSVDQRSVGLKLRGAVETPLDLARGLHKRVKSKHFDKTKFALGVLTRKEGDWVVPSYIKQGLEWLRDQVHLEGEQELEAVVEAVAEVVAAAAEDEQVAE